MRIDTPTSSRLDLQDSRHIEADWVAIILVALVVGWRRAAVIGGS